MQRKTVFDTCIYIDIFNDNKNTDQINWINNVTFLAYPVFHELMTGAGSKKEATFYQEFADRFLKLERLIFPSFQTLNLIGQTCYRMRNKGKLDPSMPKHYNDIFIALLARQIGATIVTKNRKDFKLIGSFVDINCEYV